MRSRQLAKLKMAMALLLVWSAPPAAAKVKKNGAVQEQQAVLIFSHTSGFRHKSIETGVAAVSELVRSKGMLPVASEDVAIFQKGELAPYRAIIFVNNTTKHEDASGDWLVGAAADNFRAWLKNGGAVVGLHAASDSHFFQPWYGEMIGAYFVRHPRGIRNGQVQVVDPQHPSVKAWNSTEIMLDEWYVFRNFDPASVNLIVTLDPATIGEPAGPAWPIAWSKQFEGGRIFYTAMGHSYESYANPKFMAHVEGGLDWTLNKK